MKDTDALRIITEASHDARLTARLDPSHVKKDGRYGYQVILMLRRARMVTLRRADDWPDMQAAWKDL